MNVNKNLTKGEKHCLIRIERMGLKIANKSITDLSEEVCYSTATITRLVRKLGYKDLKDYRDSVVDFYTVVSSDTYVNKVSLIKCAEFKHCIKLSAIEIILAETIYIIDDNEQLLNLIVALNIRDLNVKKLKSSELEKIKLKKDIVVVSTENLEDLYDIKQVLFTTESSINNSENKIVLHTTHLSNEISCSNLIIAIHYLIEEIDIKLLIN